GSGDDGPNWNAWYDQFRKLEEATANPPFREDDRVPGAATVTYAAVLRFNQVVEARSQWESLKQRLERVRDLAAALGLLGPLADHPAVLVIPKQPEFTVRAARDRLADLLKSHPNAREQFTVATLPDAVARPLRLAAKVNYEHLLEAGRNEVLRHLQAASPDGK